MRESLFSPLWHRYAKQRPQLRSHVVIQSQHYRDQVWHVLTNSSQGSHFRVNDIAYQFIGRCNGQYTVQQVWDSLFETLKDDAPTQDEIIHLLNSLDQRDLIRYEILPNISNMFRQKKEQKKREKISHINPLAFRMPLWNPTNFLNKASWLTPWLFNPFMLFLWLIAVIAGFLAAGAHWQTLSQHASTHITTPHYLLLTWLSFPLIKLIHELGHALSVRHWGGEVTETGITLFVLTPAPYVDASAASAFRNKYQRMLVSAIGIMVELFLAAIALFIWFSSQPGLIHDVAFVTMFICTVSSLLFNGNPLLRFDAYYMLSDAFELPNLIGRSRQYWGALIKSFALGSNNVTPMSFARGEEKWLFAYAPISLVYILSIMSVIIFLVGKVSVLLGLILTAFAVFTILISPSYKIIKNTLSAAEGSPKANRAKTLIAVFLATATLFIFIVPIPFSKTAQGVIWTPEQAQLRPTAEGFIKRIHVNHGELVEINQLIIELEDHNLLAKRKDLSNQITSMQTDQYNLIFNDPVRANAITKRIESKQAELMHIEHQITGLKIYSQVKGRLVMPHQEDVLNTFVERGAVLAHILNKDFIKVRVAVPEPDMATIQERLQQIEVRTAEYPNNIIIGKMGSDTPAVTHRLPSAAMGDIGGGKYVTDPSDKNGLTALNPLVVLDVNLPKTELQRVGGRVNVRFNLGLEPIGIQFKRHASQLFLRYFNPNE